MDNKRSTAASAAGNSVNSMLAQALDHFQHGHHDATARLIGPLLRAQPGNPSLWNLAGATAKGLKQGADAERCWRRAIAVAPDFAEAHFNLALLLHEAGRTSEAIDGYRAAIRYDSAHGRAINNLGSALAKLGRLEEALHCYEQAVALNPGHASAQHNLGRALADVGRFDEAYMALDTAIALAPAAERARYFRTLAFLKKLGPEDPQLKAMEALAQEMERLPPGDRMQLHFALGKAYGDIGERRRSFAHLLEGNREKRRQTHYDETAVLAGLERIAQVHPPALLTARQGAGFDSEVPVFIVGMPRSGSTLVEQVLASHPQVHGAGECEDFNELIGATRLPDGRPLSPDSLAALGDEALRGLGERYVAGLRQRAPQARRITDKNLTNFLRVGLIHLALPRARFIHTRRDPVDTCFSCFSLLFNGSHPYAYDLAELGRYWLAYDRLMAHWRAVLPPGVMLEVRYEDMVDDLEGQARRLLTHCRLDWDDACLDFHKTRRVVHTASVTQVRKPIYRSSVQKWREYGQDLRPLLDVLGRE